jgi:energy-coupling factor transport system permease protein
MAAIFSVVIIIFRDPYYLIIWLIIIFIQLFTTKVSIKKALRFPILCFIPALVVSLLFPIWLREGTPVFYFDWPWYHWAWITDRGIWYGISTFFRMYTFALGIFFVLIVTGPEAIARGIELLGLGYKFGLALKLIVAFLPVFSGMYSTIREAQMARALDTSKGSFVKRIKKYGESVRPLTFTALSYISTISITLASRAFGASPKRTSIDEYKLKLGDYAVIVIYVALVAVGAYYGFVLRQIATII